MAKCFIPGCNSNKRKKIPGISFHRFPKKNYKEWVQQLQIDSFEWTPQKVVCSLHFKDTDLDKSAFVVKLNKGAIPSYDNGSNQSDTSSPTSDKQITNYRQIASALTASASYEKDIRTNECSPPAVPVGNDNDATKHAGVVHDIHIKETKLIGFEQDGFNVRYVAMKDAYIVDNFDPISEHNYCAHEAENTNKSVFINLSGGKTGWHYIDNTETDESEQDPVHEEPIELENVQEEAPMEEVTCSICLQIKPNLVELSTQSSEFIHYDKIMGAFPDLEKDFVETLNLICQNCSENLRISYEFRNTLNETHKKYRKLGPKKKIFAKSTTKLVLKPSGIQIVKHLQETLLNEIKTISRNTIGQIEYKKVNDKKVKNILTKLSGIIIKKTENSSSDLFSYQCDVCRVKFMELLPLYHHKLYNHRCHMILNDLKRKGMPQRGNLLLKNKPETEKTCFECEKCGKKFTSEFFFDKHKIYHVKQEGLKSCCCEKCGRTFSYRAQLSAHNNVHERLEKYKCQTCNKKFRLKTSLHNHKLTHKPSAFICHICGQTFTLKSSLTNHMLHHSERKFQCQFCGSAFKRQATLNSHLRVHRNNKKFRCEECGKSFPYRQNLISHIAIDHVKKAEFKCDDCQTSYYTKKDYNAHVKKHRTYHIACTMCSNRFKNEDTLQTHMRIIHKNICKYNCENCKKRFKNEDQLNAHMRTHNKRTKMYVLLGENELQCGKCEKKFKSDVHLKLHVEKKHPEETVGQMYFCTYCNYDFDTLQELRNHYCVVFMDVHNNTNDLLPDNSDILSLL